MTRGQPYWVADQSWLMFGHSPYQPLMQMFSRACWQQHTEEPESADQHCL